MEKIEYRHPNLTAALAAFHAEAVKVVKDATAKVTGENKATGEKVKYTYGYADLGTVTEALNPILGQHGLAFTSKPTMTEQGFGLIYALKHESGEIDEGFWPLPDPTRTKPQDMGSWITYWRRYAFMATTNTFPSGEDDDGAKASSRESWDSAQTRQAFDQHRRGVTTGDAPVSAPPAQPKKEWTDAEVAEHHAKLGQADLEKAGKLYDWMAHWNLHERKIDYPGGDGLTATQVLAFRLADTAMTPEADIAAMEQLKDFGDGRGLLKVQVSDTETLDQVLTEGTGRLLRAADAAEQEAAAAVPNGTS